MLQEVREEAGHGLMFLDAIERAGLGGIDLLGPTRFLTWTALRLRPDGAAFWAMTFVGEAVTDALATRALRQGEAICPVARQILWLHHRDEARHIAAARRFLAERLPAMGPAARAALPLVVRGLMRLFLNATLYPTPASLATLGLPDSARAAAAARACPQRRAFVAACVRPALSTLADLGLTPTPATA
ncbi:MAG: diiron oxygenase [Rhodospirillales bacterium]|nr:diiron oxygenase [Rhodospirillales bacterium]